MAVPRLEHLLRIVAYPGMSATIHSIREARVRMTPHVRPFITMLCLAAIAAGCGADAPTAPEPEPVPTPPILILDIAYIEVIERLRNVTASINRTFSEGFWSHHGGPRSLTLGSDGCRVRLYWTSSMAPA